MARKGIGISEVGEVAEYLELPDKNSYQKLTNYLYNLFPSFETSVQNGIENGGQEIGKRVKRIIKRNSYALAEDFLEEASEKYSKELAANASSYIYEFSPKLIPVIGSLIGGVTDCYSTYKAGKNCIKYFEEYINKTQGCEFVLKRKEEYEKILNSLDILENDNFANFEINIFN